MLYTAARWSSVTAGCSVQERAAGALGAAGWRGCPGVNLPAFGQQHHSVHSAKTFVDFASSLLEVASNHTCQCQDGDFSLDSSLQCKLLFVGNPLMML